MSISFTFVTTRMSKISMSCFTLLSYRAITCKYRLCTQDYKVFSTAAGNNILSVS